MFLKHAYVSVVCHQTCYALLNIRAPALGEVRVVFAPWQAEQKGL